MPLLAKAAELDPDSSNYPCWLVLFNLDLGDIVEATRITEAATRHWRDDACLLDQSSNLHLYGGDPKAALRDAQRLLLLDPSDSSALYLLRNADLQTGHLERALARYAAAYPGLLDAESASCGPDQLVHRA